MTSRTITIVAIASSTDTAPIAIPAPRLGGNDSDAVPIPPMMTAQAAKAMPMMKNGVSLCAASAARIKVACVISGTLPNAAAGRDLEVEATRERDPLDPLPWDHVRSGVSKEFLLDEWWQSRAERPTGDCRWDGCSDCGACVGPVRNRLVEA